MGYVAGVIQVFWKKYKANITSPNRTVYASPPEGGSASVKHQSAQAPLWCFTPAHFFVPVKMLRIFLYRAQKNVIYRRNVMRHKNQKDLKIKIKTLFHKL